MATGQTVACASHLYQPPWQTYPNAGKTEVIQTTPNIIVKISNVFNGDLYYKPGTVVTVRCEKLRNPRTLSLTDPIEVRTVSPSMPSVDASWQFPIQMKRLPSFKDVVVTPGSLVTGALTTYTFTFVSGQEMITGHKVLIDLT